MASSTKTTIRPSDQAGSLPDDPIFRRWRAGPGVRSTTRVGQSWKSTTNESSKPEPFACPKCGEVIVYDRLLVAGCGSCSWSPTRKEREEIDARDPEMIPVRQYTDRMEQHSPAFEGHANLKRLSGKERREKRFLSKCARGGC